MDASSGCNDGRQSGSIGACELFAREALVPCAIVIFGASGDLTARKLIPALYNLFVNDALPSPVSIVGCSRTEMDHEAFRVHLHDFLAELGGIDLCRWAEFAENIFYQPLDYGESASYATLQRVVSNLDRSRGTAGNRIFYLAVPPDLYPVIGAKLGSSGLAVEGKNGKAWARIVVEKPFGRDLATAVELDSILHHSFAEHQIFRIDHYLAKETVQNILMLRFANTIFEPIWNRSFIDYVGIITAEKLGVEHRAGYYEQAGVLRDMFQNHMMQLLALTAMEAPSHFEAARVQDEKVKVFRSLKPLAAEDISENLILGQYGAGIIDGRPVPGYRDEPDVRPESLTPTYAMLRVFIDNWRWRGVPFYLTSGKRMARKKTAIIIQFKQVPHSMFRNVLSDDILANRLTLGIYPDEEISLTFQAKRPGAKDCLQPVTMDFKYQRGLGLTLDAYEMVLLDCILGDHMLFWRQDGVEHSWSFLTPILKECDSCAYKTDELQFYEAGTFGPDRAKAWMDRILNLGDA